MSAERKQPPDCHLLGEISHKAGSAWIFWFEGVWAPRKRGGGKHSEKCSSKWQQVRLTSRKSFCKIFRSVLFCSKNTRALSENGLQKVQYKNPAYTMIQSEMPTGGPANHAIRCAKRWASFGQTCIGSTPQTGRWAKLTVNYTNPMLIWRYTERCRNVDSSCLREQRKWSRKKKGSASSTHGSNHLKTTRHAKHAAKRHRSF